VIHITEVAADKAALAIADLCDDKGGEWLVNAVDDEGFVAARVGYPAGRRLARSGSPNIAGPFNARWRISVIAADLAAAQEAGRPVHAVDTSSRIRKPQSRYELMTRILEMLSTRQCSMSDITQATGADVEAVRPALSRLKQSGEIVSRRNRDATYVYSLAACERKAA
jgi:hypothetical protein